MQSNAVNTWQCCSSSSSYGETEALLWQRVCSSKGSWLVVLTELR